MKEAQTEIKSNIVVNTGDPLGGTNAGLNEIADKDESAKKREREITSSYRQCGKYLLSFVMIRID